MVDSNGKLILIEKEIEVFIQELFPNGYEVIYFYMKEGKIYNFDGISDYVINPIINIVIKDIKSQNLYRILLKKESHGPNGFAWWIYRTSADGRKYKLRLLQTTDIEKVKSYINEVNLLDMLVSIYDSAKVVDIYDGLDDKSLQCIHIAVDQMDGLEEGEDGLVEDLSNDLMNKCINLIKRSGFNKEGFVYLTDDRTQLIFEAVRS